MDRKEGSSFLLFFIFGLQTVERENKTSCCQIPWADNDGRAHSYYPLSACSVQVGLYIHVYVFLYIYKETIFNTSCFCFLWGGSSKMDWYNFVSMLLLYLELSKQVLKYNFYSRLRQEVSRLKLP